MNNQLPEVCCPKCGRVMTECDGDANKTATEYADCIRKCSECHIGASNGKREHTFIYENPCESVPERYRGPELEYTLENALNELNKRKGNNKKTKFGYSTSEDALTWIFIRHFIQESKLPLLMNSLGLDDNDVKEILLWGVPQLRTDSDKRKILESICQCELNEAPNCLSEPDIIIETNTEVIFIEVKLKSHNVNGGKTSNYNRYSAQSYYANFDAAKESKRYELVRNWTIGNLYAAKQHKSFILFNLVPQSLIRKDHALDTFKSSLATPDAFKTRSWEDVLRVIENEDTLWVGEIRRRLALVHSI